MLIEVWQVATLLPAFWRICNPTMFGLVVVDRVRAIGDVGYVVSE